MARRSKRRAENEKRDTEEAEAKMKMERVREQETKEAKSPKLDSAVKHEMGAGIGMMMVAEICTVGIAERPSRTD
jgi:hypothetical protein